MLINYLEAYEHIPWDDLRYVSAMSAVQMAAALFCSLNAAGAGGEGRRLICICQFILQWPMHTLLPVLTSCCVLLLLCLQMFGEVFYGGHITDGMDRRCCTTYLQVRHHGSCADA